MKPSFILSLFFSFLLFRASAVEVKDVSDRIDSLFVRAEIFENKGEIDSSMIILGIAYEQAVSVGSMDIQCKILNKLGYLEAKTGDHEKAIPTLKLAIQKCGECNDNVLLAGCHNYLGVVYDRRDEHDLSLEQFMMAIRINEMIQDTDELARSYMNLVSIFGQMEKPEKVKEYIRMVFSLIDQVEDMQIKSYVLWASASQYTEIGDQDPAYLDSAGIMAKMGLQFAKQMEDYSRITQLYTVFSTIYYLRKDYWKCISYADSVLRFKSDISPQTAIITYIRQSDGFFGLGDLKTALLYLDSAQTIVDEIGSSFYQMIIDESRYELYKKNGQFDLALRSLEELRAIEDSLLRLEKDAAISELQTRYETEKKEQQVQLLKSENELQELVYSRQRIIAFLVILCLLLLTIIVIVYYQKRVVQQKGQIAIHKQQLLRSQVNPHFIFNALTSIRGFLFDRNNVNEAVTYLTKFARLMRMILDHSSKEWVSLEEEIEALKIYLEIQQMRFSQRFSFEFHIDDEISPETVRVPPLMAQPFIENAIEHGFKNIDYPGEVVFSCQSKGNTIRFVITDNGVGINYSQATQVSHQSRALQIFKQRIELLSRQMNIRLSYYIKDLNEATGRPGTMIQYELPNKAYYA